MAEYTLAHVGINGANAEEARKAAELAPEDPRIRENLRLMEGKAGA